MGAGKGSESKGSGKERAKPKTKQARAGLLLPVGRVNTALKTRSGLKRVGGSAAVYMAAVLEYVASEVLEAAGNHTLQANRKRVTPDDVVVSIRCDADLAKVARGFATFSGDRIANAAAALKPAA